MIRSAGRQSKLAMRIRQNTLGGDSAVDDVSVHWDVLLDGNFWNDW